MGFSPSLMPEQGTTADSESGQGLSQEIVLQLVMGGQVPQESWSDPNTSKLNNLCLQFDNSNMVLVDNRNLRR